MPKEIEGIGSVWELAELAAALGVAPSSITRYWKAGRLPGQKVGRNTYFTADAVKTFLEGQNKNKKRIEAQAQKTIVKGGDPSRKGKRPVGRNPPSPDELKREAVILSDAFARNGYSFTKAAESLGLSRWNFRYKAERCGLLADMQLAGREGATLRYEASQAKNKMLKTPQK